MGGTIVNFQRNEAFLNFQSWRILLVEVQDGFAPRQIDISFQHSDRVMIVALYLQHSLLEQVSTRNSYTLENIGI